MRGNPNDPSYPTVYHIVPPNRGGSDDIHNLVAACRGCNSAKGNRSQTQFQARRTPTPGRARPKPSEYVSATPYTGPVYATTPPPGDGPNWALIAVGAGIVLAMILIVAFNWNMFAPRHTGSQGVVAANSWAQTRAAPVQPTPAWMGAIAGSARRQRRSASARPPRRPRGATGRH